VVGCDVVDTYVLLGCLIDEGLTFVPLLKATCARSMEQFVRLYHAGESGGFSVPVVSAQVPIRIEPGIMYVAPLLFLADRMRYSLDRLQIRWARMLLNCGSGPPLNWALLRLQCGWELRLSTKVLEATFMAFARLQILPSTHPGARMLNVACLSGAETWAVKVRAALSSSELPEPIPELAQCGLFSMEAITQSRTDKEARRQLLRRYRHAVVRTILTQMDVQVLQQTLSCHSSFPPWSLADFVTGSPRIPMDLLEVEWSPRIWLHFRVWSLIRISGRWPLTCWGLSTLPYVLLVCPLCGAPQVSPGHILMICPGTLHLYLQLVARSCSFAARSSNVFMFNLFHEAGSEQVWQEQMEYVGGCVEAVARHPNFYRSLCADPVTDNLEDDSSESVADM